MIRGARIVVALSLVIPGAALSASVTHGTAHATGEPSPRLAWERCGGGIECASLAVPVDHAAPDGEELELELARRPADDRDRRVGTLVVNYGGPGDAGTETLRATADYMPAAIRQHFDILSFDPRGVGGSAPVRCVDDATFEAAWSEDPTPDGIADLRAFYDGTSSSVDLVAECIARHGDWLARVGTRNVARDLELIRAAVGDERLTFLGYSYGTLLGAIYAQEHPDRVRAMVLDAAVDLTSTTAEEQRDSVAGFENALDEFLDDCASDEDCAFHSRGKPRAALEELRARFEQGVRIDAGEGRTVGASEFYVGLVAALYSRAEWPILAAGLQDATIGDGSTLLLLNDLYAGRRDDGTYSNLQQVIGMVVCADEPEPLVSFDEYRATFEQLTADHPFFGPLFAGGPSGCDPRLPRPRADEQVGDVRVAGTAPVLVVGATRDPATPYVGAKDLRTRIEGARLLTVDDTSHGSYASGNRCVDRIVDRYLVTGEPPARDRRC